MMNLVASGIRSVARVHLYIAVTVVQVYTAASARLREPELGFMCSQRELGLLGRERESELNAKQGINSSPVANLVYLHVAHFAGNCMYLHHKVRTCIQPEGKRNHAVAPSRPAPTSNCCCACCGFAAQGCTVRAWLGHADVR